AMVAPGAARAEAHGPKVEATLGQLVDAVAPDTPVHVFVFGSSLAGANAAVGVSARNDLDVLGGESVTISASKVDQLAAQSGVQFVAPDRPVVPTGADAPLGSALETLYPRIDNVLGTWAAGFTGAGVGIAVVDSGVTPRKDFGQRLVQVKLPTQDGTQLDDGVGHGSAVAA